MLFLTRAGLCIGTIVVLAEGGNLSDLVALPKEAAGTLAESAARPLEAFCRERPADCIAAVKAAVTAGAVSAPPIAPPSATHKARQDTLQRPPDRRDAPGRRV